MRVSRVIDAANTWIARVIMWLIIPQIAALVYEVVARYVFNSPTTWSLDLTWLIYGTHYLMGAAYTLLVKGHIKVEVFHERMSPVRQAIVHLACYLIFFFPVIMALIYGGAEFAYLSWSAGELSQHSSWRPVVWPFKVMMVVGFFLLFLQGISEFIRLLASINRKGMAKANG